MNETFIVNELKAWNNLICDHQHSLQGKLSITQFEVVLKRCSQEFSDDKVKISIFSVPQKVGYPNTSLNFLEDFTFICKKTWFNSFRFTLDGAVDVRLNVSAWVDRGYFAFVELVFEFVATTDSDLKIAHSNIYFNQYIVSLKESFQSNSTAYSPDTMFSMLKMSILPRRSFLRSQLRFVSIMLTTP